MICQIFIKIDLIFGAAGLNAVMNGIMRFFGFSDSLLFSNLILVIVFFIAVSE